MGQSGLDRLTASLRSLSAGRQHQQLYHQQMGLAMPSQPQQSFQLPRQPAGMAAMVVQEIDPSDVVLGDGKRDETTLNKRPGNNLFNAVVKEHRYAFWQAPR